MVLLSLLIFIITIIAIILWFLRQQHSFWKKLNIPYVEPDFGYGNLKGVGTEDHLTQRLEDIYNKFKNKTPVVGMYFFYKPAALALDQDLIKTILIKDAAFFNDRGMYYNERDQPISAHLFNIHGPKWKSLRTKLTPTFTSGKIKFMFATIYDVSKRLEKKLDLVSKQPQDSVEVRDILARYATDVIGTCAFGIECNTLHDNNAEFRKMSLKIFDEPKYGVFSTLIITSVKEFAQKFGIKEFYDDVSTFFSTAVKEALDFREANDVRRNDFLDMMIQIKNNSEKTADPLTLNEIYAQSFVFFVAGFETSSTLLTFCLYELAIHQDIQERVREHIEEIIAKHNDQITYEAMMDMKYLDQILNETLRLYSPLSYISRTAEIDYKVPDTNYVIKKGTWIIIPIHSIHKDPNFYPNPEQFNPDNFSEENFKNRPSTTFLAFGEGPRNCIGARFGMMQSRLGLISVLRKFKVSIPSNMTTPVSLNKNAFFTSPVGGMNLKVEKL